MKNKKKEDFTEVETQVFLTPRELAKRWGMNPTSLSNWRSKNKGPKYVQLMGHKVLYSLEELEKFEKQNIVEVGTNAN